MKPIKLPNLSKLMPERPSPLVLRELLAYNTATGLFRWLPRDASWFPDDRAAKSWNTRFANRPTFVNVNKQGYYYGVVLCHRALAHRVALAIGDGEWPPEHCDHINHDRLDNRFSNLRAVSQAENSKNLGPIAIGQSGHRGIRLSLSGKWDVRISHQNKAIHLGAFVKKDDAIMARAEAEIKYGYHPNHGTATP